MTEDVELLRRYAAHRSELAFGELVRRHLDLVYTVALRRVYGDRMLAQDITQSVFTDLAKKANSLSGRPVLNSWLFKSTQFAAAKALRAESRRRVRDLEAMTQIEPSQDSESNVDSAQLRPIIDELLLNLHERDREAIVLRFFTGLNYAELGSKLRLSQDGARSRVERALDKMRRMLIRRGLTSVATALTGVLACQPLLSAPAGLAAAIAKTALLAPAAMKFGLSQVAIGGTVAILGAGLFLYEATRTHTPAIPSASQVEISRIQQSPIDGPTAIGAQSVGGAASHLVLEDIARLDMVVGLRDDQFTDVTKIFAKKWEAWRFGAHRENGMLTKNARAQVRFLLTPEQRTKFDPVGNYGDDPAAKAYVENFIETSPRIVARVGAISSVTRVGNGVSSQVSLLSDIRFQSTHELHDPTVSDAKTWIPQDGGFLDIIGDENGRFRSEKGGYIYLVTGALGSATLIFYWERPAPMAPVEVLRIEKKDGETIPL